LLWPGRLSSSSPLRSSSSSIPEPVISVYHHVVKSPRRIQSSLPRHKAFYYNHIPLLSDIFQQRPSCLSCLKADKPFDPGLLKSNIRKF
jgi:hypothetical protein